LCTCLEELTTQALTPTPERVGTDLEVIQLDAPELVEAPAELRRRDGSSQFQAPVGTVYATRGALTAEEQLQRAARRPGGAPALPVGQVDAALDAVNAQLAEQGHQLGEDQAARDPGDSDLWPAGRGADRPAGTGKSFTLGALHDLWKDRELWGQEDRLPQPLSVWLSPRQPRTCCTRRASTTSRTSTTG